MLLSFAGERMPGRVVILFLLILTHLNSLAYEPTEEELTPEELEQWFESDSSYPGYIDTSAGAELKIIAPISDKLIPSSHTRLTITSDSLNSGWIGIKQCHDNLDPVPDAEVVYRFRAMRGLQITESSHIEKSWVEGQSVQLKNVERPARLCIEAEAQVLYKEEDGSYRLRYGSFQRKFLDGYFPYHVSLDVYYPEKMLVVSHIEPSPELEYSLAIEPGTLRADVWFTGRLSFEYRFEKR